MLFPPDQLGGAMDWRFASWGVGTNPVRRKLSLSNALPSWYELHRLRQRCAWTRPPLCQAFRGACCGCRQRFVALLLVLSWSSWGIHREQYQSVPLLLRGFRALREIWEHLTWMVPAEQDVPSPVRRFLLVLDWDHRAPSVPETMEQNWNKLVSAESKTCIQDSNFVKLTHFDCLIVFHTTSIMMESGLVRAMRFQVYIHRGTKLFRMVMCCHWKRRRLVTIDCLVFVIAVFPLSRVSRKRCARTRKDHNDLAFWVRM